jgi:hypothetical protein
MGNIAKWIEEIADGEAIEAAVVGRHDGAGWDADAPHPVGKVMPWDQARAILDYDYYDGYGSADCHPVFAWTATKIITVIEYDGATGPAWYPRHPVDVVPGFDGVSIYG